MPRLSRTWPAGFSLLVLALARAASAESLFSNAGEAYRFEDIDLTIRPIPAGNCLIGSPLSEVGRQFDEGPEMQFKSTSVFWMATTTVTQAQWHTVMGSTQKELLESAGEDVDLVPSGPK